MYETGMASRQLGLSNPTGWQRCAPKVPKTSKPLWREWSRHRRITVSSPQTPHTIIHQTARGETTVTWEADQEVGLALLINVVSTHLSADGPSFSKDGRSDCPGMTAVVFLLQSAEAFRKAQIFLIATSGGPQPFVVKRLMCSFPRFHAAAPRSKSSD